MLTQTCGIVDAPTIGVPSTTSAPSGTTVTIDGNNFESAMHVYFNGYDLSFVLVSKTQFTTDFSRRDGGGSVPPFTGPITVTNSVGSVQSTFAFALT